MTPRPRPAGTTETRIGLALLRDLAAGGQLVHDETTEIDEALALAQVKETATGLLLVGNGHRHLVRAVVWAVASAHKPTRYRRSDSQTGLAFRGGGYVAGVTVPQ